MVLPVLGVISVVALLGAAGLSGAIQSGQWIRWHYQSESAAERTWRVRAAGVLLLTALAAGALAYLLYRLGIR